MKNNYGNRLRDYLQLSKLTIMLPVCLTGFTGFFMFDSHFSFNLFLTSIGILLMAVSASTLNQIQEKGLDRRMNRTHHRPLPSGRITMRHAVVFFLCTLVAGTFLIFSGGNISAALTGLFTILWYNGVYTYSKRLTAFAVVPGALTGALPPLIGWLAAGGGFWDKPIIFLEFLFFTGQIPHFWLLVLKYGEEYNKAGIPTLTNVFSLPQINRLTFTWVVTSVIAAVFLGYFEIITTGIVVGILLAASAFLILNFSSLLKHGTEVKANKKYSILLDSYFLLILILLIVDRVLVSCPPAPLKGG